MFLCKVFLLDDSVGTEAIQSIKINKSKFGFYIAMSFFSVFGFITFLYGLKDIMIANAMSIKYVEQIQYNYNKYYKK